MVGCCLQSTDLTVSLLNEDEHFIEDLTVDSPLFLEMYQVFSLDDELTNQLSSTNVMNSERANTNLHSSAVVSTANTSIMDRNSDIRLRLK